MRTLITPLWLEIVYGLFFFLHILSLMNKKEKHLSVQSGSPWAHVSGPCQGFLFRKCLKCYQRAGVLIKEVNFKEFHLCRLPPLLLLLLLFNLAGLWQSKVNKCEAGHVFSILCHTCSLSFPPMINIPPTPGRRTWRDRRLGAARNAPRRATWKSRRLFTHFLSIWNPLSLSERAWQDAGVLCLLWKTWRFPDRLVFIGLGWTAVIIWIIRRRILLLLLLVLLEVRAAAWERHGTGGNETTWCDF